MEKGRRVEVPEEDSERMGLKTPTLLLDSSVLIDHMADRPEAVEFLRTHAKSCAITPITYAVVLAGCEDAAFGDCVELLEAFPRLELTSEALQTAAKYRRAYSIKLPDAFQAALAFTFKMTLVTKDAKDLSPKRFPFVKIPY